MNIERITQSIEAETSEETRKAVYVALSQAKIYYMEWRHQPDKYKAVLNGMIRDVAPRGG